MHHTWEVEGHFGPQFPIAVEEGVDFAVHEVDVHVDEFVWGVGGVVVGQELGDHLVGQ